MAPTDQSAFPDMADDFAVLEHDLMPKFRDADAGALRQQNTFYLVQLTLSVGAVTATILGAVQAAFGGQVVVGAAEAALSALLGAGAFGAFAQGAQRSYYTHRLQAERLRSEYFLYLGRVGPYLESKQPERVLKQRVDDICR